MPALLARVHAFLAVPPMELDAARYELYPVTNWAMVLGLLSHASFVPLFAWLGVPTLSLFNTLSVGAFGAAVLLARRAALNASLLVAWAEVAAHAVLATTLLGWQTGFHYHVLLALVLVQMYSILPLASRVGIAVVTGIVYSGLALWSWTTPASHPLGPTVEPWLLALNLIIFLTVLSGICLYYTWTVTTTRNARDQAVEELREALERTRELDRMKTDFTSMVSHELRTPLTSILGFAKVTRSRLEERVLPKVPLGERRVERAVGQVRENLGIIVSEGERLTTLINDLLDIAKMEAGQMEYAAAPIDPAMLAKRVRDAVSGLFQTGPDGAAAIELRVEVDEGLPSLIGDRDRLIQVLVNLVSNARKFTDTGSVTVGVHETVSGNRVRFEVIDTGAGIASGDLAGIFEKFRQVGSLDDRPKGSGLGLAICRQIVDAHGGMLRVESTPGQGSRFFFDLPVAHRPEGSLAPG